MNPSPRQVRPSSYSSTSTSASTNASSPSTYSTPGTTSTLNPYRRLNTPGFKAPPFPSSNNKPTKNRPRFANPSQLITLIGGPANNESRFTVHKDYACFYSPVLKAALNSAFKEGQSQSYRVDTAIGAETVGLLVQWIYTQDLAMPTPPPVVCTISSFTPMPPIDEATILAAAHFRNLIRLHILANYLIIPSLQNAIIPCLESLGRVHGCLGTRLFHFIYDNTSADSPLRKYISHAAASAMDVQFLEKDPEAFPREMLYDILVTFMRDDVCAARISRALAVGGNLKRYFVSEEGEGFGTERKE